MTTSLTRSAVRVYGALSGLGNGSNNIFEKLIPFFEPILRPKQGSLLNIEEFAQEVREAYRWNFTADIVEVFVPFLLEVNWIYPESEKLPQGPYVVNLPEEIGDTSNETSASEALRTIALEFKEFSEALSPLTAIPREVEEFEDILIEWLLYVEAFSEKNVEFETRTGKDENGTLRQFTEIPKVSRISDEEEFLCARFVRYAIENKPQTAEILSKIASIGLLTEVVQDFVKPSQSVQQSNLVVYLDAPVAMELLGVSGAAARQNTQHIIQELQRVGVTVRVFGQSIAEIQHSLLAVLKNPRPTGPTAQALARGEVMREFVEQVAREPARILLTEDVQTRYRDLEQFPGETKYFDRDARNEIYAALSFQNNIHAREHDSDITTLVMRQRSGHESPDIFQSKFLIITRNGLLAQVVQKRCIENGFLSVGHVPPVIHRKLLAATMWFRTGFGDEQLEVPKRMLLSNCERVLAIRPSVVEAVARVTRDLGDEEKMRQLDLLISHSRAAEVLMDKTLGVPSTLTENNISELFDEMLHPYLEEERAKGQENVKKITKEKSSEIKKIKSDLEHAENEIFESKGALELIKEEDREALDALFFDVSRRLDNNKKSKTYLAYAVSVCLFAPAFFTQSNIFSWLSFGIGCFLTYLSITGSKVIGLDVSEQDAARMLEKRAAFRGLKSKLSRVEVIWDGKTHRLTVDHHDTLSASDLFGGEGK
ncbi:hypothetical protein [Thalassospira lucentensis]|uniref:hypothetical protein n=1 Tax=Thalassospira lucentensis TaxID=168935 RepID=UPI00142E2107|nr:hypothetical protein [Thalassospira lucentensis]NIZ01886.1 hypothetical protein [Thalassospira lucentensis]